MWNSFWAVVHEPNPRWKFLIESPASKPSTEITFISASSLNAETSCPSANSLHRKSRELNVIFCHRTLFLNYHFFMSEGFCWSKDNYFPFKKRQNLVNSKKKKKRCHRFTYMWGVIPGIEYAMILSWE